MENAQFKGFDRDTLLLLAENKFNDSKVYYESVKETLKQKATVPMRQLCSDLCDELFEIDEQMNLIPSKMVSRIRRDTRFAKNKEMYRDNMWCMFMRDKHRYSNQPCMWFEFMPGGWSVGVGMYRAEPKYLDAYRKVFLENQSLFKNAVKSAEAVGAICDMEQYKKPKDGSETLPKALVPYYNAKYLYFIYYSSDVEPLFDASVIDKIRECINAYTPMYQFLLRVTDKMIAEKGNSYE
ncbi:MAG: DUF2461 domain-containing protein [Acutalibacteraceae bacterium]